MAVKVSGRVNSRDAAALIRKLRKLPEDAQREILIEIAKGAEIVRSHAVRSIQRQSPSSGPVTRYDPKRTVTPALRGNPPNRDEGTLASNIVTERDGRNLAYFVISRARHSAWMEFGFRAVNGVRHGPWPFLFPALEANRKRVQDGIARGIARAIRKAARR